MKEKGFFFRIVYETKVYPFHSNYQFNLILLIRKFALDFIFCSRFELRNSITCDKFSHEIEKSLNFKSLFSASFFSSFISLLLSCLTAQIINNCRSTETGNDILLLHIRYHMVATRKDNDACD